MSSKKIFNIYIFLLSLFLGFFQLYFTGSLVDLVFIVFLGFLFPAIRKYYKRSDKPTKSFFIVWLLFIGYNTAVLVSTAPLYSQISSLLNVRGIYAYLLVFLTPVVMNYSGNLDRMTKAIFVMAVIAFLVITVQSLYGATPIFDTTLFYNIGSWKGAGVLKIGPLSRVILPTTYFTYILFIGLVIYSITYKSAKYLLILALLSVPIFIGYARSHWLAIFLAIYLVFILLFFMRQVKLANFVVINVVAVLLISAVIGSFSYINEGITNALTERLLSGFEDYSNNEGTYNTRVENSERFIAEWSKTGYWTGVDPGYVTRRRAPELTDVGYVYVLVTSGMVGFVLYLLVCLWAIFYGFSLLKRGKMFKSKIYTSTGASLVAIIVFFLIAQQYTQFEYTSALWATACGMAIAVRNTLFGQKVVLVETSADVSNDDENES